MLAVAAVPQLVPKPPGLTSATGVLALLEEENDALKAHALKKLHVIVDEFWAEIADFVINIEELSEDENFGSKDLAASVASKCYFHLEEYDDALRLALGAGDYFDISSNSEYVETLISKCIDKYVELRIANISNPDGAEDIDPRMENVVERMFQRCYADSCFDDAIGVAIDARRLDKVEEAINNCPEKAPLLSHTLKISESLVASREFRQQILKLLVKMYKGLSNPDHIEICQCLQILNDSKSVSETLDHLVKGDTDATLVAYQVAFNICENDNQAFTMAVADGLPKPAAPAAESAAAGEGGGEATEGEAAAAAPAAAETREEEVTDAPVPEGAPADYWQRVGRLRQILAKGFPTALALDFLYSQSSTDLLVLQNIKAAVESRNSILHNSTVVAHAYMSGGTTIDTFLRSNLEWFARATNWAKFTAAAGIGVVHKGHVKQSMELLRPYLPQNGQSQSPYSEGGALFALGLIHANAESMDDGAAIAYLQNALSNAGPNDIVQHGACLGLGLAAMATANPEVIESLKNTLLGTDSSTAGEGAALSIGLLLLGKGNDNEVVQSVIHELTNYAHETKREKVIRAITLGIALMMFGQEEAAESLVEQLVSDKDPIVRYGAMFVIGLAYCGTGSNTAIRRLLHVSVSDVNDSVRRAAVTCLGFVLFKQPEKLPSLVALLAESFNGHVRYGACMAVGIGCAGTGRADAIALLEPMLEDALDFVRQGAMLAMAMVVMQVAHASNSKTRIFREKLIKIVSDKHQTVMTKMGAILAQGILDAGGRNVVISMQTRVSAVVGLMMWTQYWYWYPLLHFLSLAFQPTAIIGLTKDLKMPKSFTTKCNAKASLFAPPKHLEAKKEEKKVRVEAAVLSTTARAKAREKLKAAKEGKDKEDGMEVEKEEEKKEEGKEGEGDKEKAKKEEPATHVLANPARLTLAQRTHVDFDMEQRYVPVHGGAASGIVMLKDKEPDEPEELREVTAPKSSAEEDEEDAEPPEPFEWTPPSTE